MTAVIFILGWVGGGSAMWLYLRFGKFIRNRAEHRKALKEEFFHPKDSKGLIGAIANCDTTEFKEYARNYFKVDGFPGSGYLPQLTEGGDRKCEK